MGLAKSLLITLIVLLLCVGLATAAFATDAEQLKTEITSTALVILLIAVCVVSIVFVVKREFNALIAFIGISIIVITIVATKGDVLVKMADWVAGWFGSSTGV